EEITALIEEVAALPKRTFYVWDREAPYRAQLIRASDFEPNAGGFLPEEIARRIRLGSAAIPISVLEAHQRERGPAAAPLGPALTLGTARRRRGAKDAE